MTRAELRRAKARDPQAHTRAVNMAKVALPAVALLVLLVIFLWPLIAGPGSGRRAGPENGTLEMTQARFIGIDGKRRPYEISAARVAQQGKGAKVELEKPSARITLPTGEVLTVTAALGSFDKDSGRLSLSGGVTVARNGDYEFVTETAEVDTKQGLAWGESQVKGKGPLGFVESSGFRIEDEGASVKLTGKSRLRLEDGVKQ